MHKAECQCWESHRISYTIIDRILDIIFAPNEFNGFFHLTLKSKKKTSTSFSMETSKLEASNPIEFDHPLTVTKRAVRLASRPGPLDFARAAISASATKPTGKWQAPDHFYPCLSIHSVTIGLSICVCIPWHRWHTCLSVVNCEKCTVSSLKNVWLILAKAPGGPVCSFFFPSLDFCIDVQRNSRLLHRGHRMFQGNVKLKMLKLQEPPFEWNDAYICILYILLMNNSLTMKLVYLILSSKRQRTPVTSSATRLNQPHLLTQLVASFLRMLNLLQMFICHEEIKNQPYLYKWKHSTGVHTETLSISILLLALPCTVDLIEHHIQLIYIT